MEIKETKLTSDIINALCKICEECSDDPDLKYGEECEHYKDFCGGCCCDHIHFFFTDEVCENDECKFHPDNCDGKLTISRCVTCALKSGALKV